MSDEMPACSLCGGGGLVFLNGGVEAKCPNCLGHLLAMHRAKCDRLASACLVALKALDGMAEAQGPYEHDWCKKERAQLRGALGIAEDRNVNTSQDVGATTPSL